MRTRNLAIVFTDISGFTARTARQTHEENRRLLRAHDALLKTVFRAYGGRVVKAIGDAFLVVFPSPTEAVLCGAALQDRLWQWNRSAPDDLQLQVRIAVNVGEVRLERDDVFGAPVNVASRVERLAGPGEVLFTDMVWQAIDRARIPAHDLGPHRLRGVPEPVRLFAVERHERPDDPPYGGTQLGRIPPLPPVAEVTGRFGPLRRFRAVAALSTVAAGLLLFLSRSLTATPPPATVVMPVFSGTHPTGPP